MRRHKETEEEAVKRRQQMYGCNGKCCDRVIDPFGTCRNCGCHIMWVKTKAGKNMPVDPTIISYRRPGAGVKAKEKIVTPEGEVVCADKVSSESAEGFGYISHFATCKARNR